MKILTVDDSRTIRNLLRIELEKAGHEVCQADDGVNALKALENFDPDVVITDLNMPNMDGIELTRNLRERKSTQFVPILILSTESAIETRQRGRAAGATGWLVKPFNTISLLATIDRVSP